MVVYMLDTLGSSEGQGQAEQLVSRYREQLPSYREDRVIFIPGAVRDPHLTTAK